MFNDMYRSSAYGRAAYSNVYSPRYYGLAPPKASNHTRYRPYNFQVINRYGNQFRTQHYHPSKKYKPYDKVSNTAQSEVKAVPSSLRKSDTLSELKPINCYREPLKYSNDRIRIGSRSLDIHKPFEFKGLEKSHEEDIYQPRRIHRTKLSESRGGKSVESKDSQQQKKYPRIKPDPKDPKRDPKYDSKYDPKTDPALDSKFQFRFDPKYKPKERERESESKGERRRTGNSEGNVLDMIPFKSAAGMRIADRERG